MTTTLQQIVAGALGLPASQVRVELRAPLTHQSNRLYDARAGARHLIVKEYLKPEELHNAPLREARALDLLAPLDVAPRLVHWEPAAVQSFGPFVVYEWMEGEMWDRRRPAPQELEQLAHLWLALHALPADNLWMSRGYECTPGEYADYLRGQLLKYAAWVRAEYPHAQPVVDLTLNLMEQRREVAAQLEQLPPMLRFCRGDARFANVIKRPDGRIGLVDWEDCGLRDPARDIADLMTAANQEDLLEWEDWQPFLRTYLRGRGDEDPSLARRVELYAAVFPILWLVILASHGLQRVRAGQLAGWTINGIAPNERLRRYLARAQAWPKKQFRAELEALGGISFFPDT